MPNRVIKESIKRSPQIDSLTWFEEVVFYRLMVSADDYGCYDGRPVVIKNELFPTKEHITTKSVRDAIQRLASVGLLLTYEVSGMPYLFFPTWEKHQRVRNKHRKYPAPPDGIDLTANCCQMSATCQTESNPNPIRIQSESERDTRARADGPGSSVPSGGSGVAHHPTFEQVLEYAKFRGAEQCARPFFDYYSAANWRDGQNVPVYNWQQKFIAWQMREGQKRSGGRAAGKGDFDPQPTIKRIQENNDWIDDFLEEQRKKEEGAT